MFDSERKTKLDKVMKEYHDEKGPIFRMSIPGQTGRVFIDVPEYLRIVLSKEGKNPAETGLDPLVYYRNVMRKDLFYDTAGLVGSHGEEVRGEEQGPAGHGPGRQHGHGGHWTRHDLSCKSSSEGREVDRVQLSVSCGTDTWA